MSLMTAPGVTGPVTLDRRSFYSFLIEDKPTGYEYGEISGGWEILIHIWGVAEPEPAVTAVESREESGLQGRAAALATETPHILSPLPPVPRLSGNLATDVHEICGLTWRQIADVFRISERAVAGWRTQGVPRHRVETMEALRAIGATLVGGLGPAGVCEWLTGGRPSRLERVRNGEVEKVARDALSYLDTPAT
jgi:hypothetical protein